MANRLEYSGQYATIVDVNIYWENDYLIAYENGDMQDGFDYEEYEERLRNGEKFEEVAEDLLFELRNRR